MRILCVWGRHNYGDATRGESYEYANFLPALEALGHAVSLFDSWDRSRYANFAELNRALVQSVREARPELILTVLLGYEIWLETLDYLRGAVGVPVLNWGTDDSWKYAQFSRYVARHVDCYATTSSRALEHAVRDGFENWMLTQWAASDTRLAQPLRAQQCRYAVSFVGSAYGNRMRWIEMLRTNGIDVACFGHGWATGAVSAAQVAAIVRESRISLNFGDSGWQLRGVMPYRSRQIKARVFEVPGAGGFLLTEPADGLEHCYRDGEEIAVFRSEAELLDRIRYYLEHPDARDRVALAGHQRTRREHTYTQRFVDLIRHAADAGTRNHTTSVVSLDMAIARHALGPGTRTLRALLSWPAMLLFGKRRGVRAARRLLFELSWRFCRARTYRSKGLPGRLFYRES